MTSDPLTIVREQGSKYLKEMRDSCPGLAGALIASDDGYRLVDTFGDDPFHGKKVAAMTSSIMGVAESLVSECDQARCRNIILDNEQGTIVSLRISPLLILIAMARPGTSVGMLLSSGKVCAEKLRVATSV